MLEVMQPGLTGSAGQSPGAQYREHLQRQPARALDMQHVPGGCRRAADNDAQGSNLRGPEKPNHV